MTTMAEITTPARPVLPGATKTVDLTKPAPTGADLPQADTFFAPLALGHDTLAQVRRSLPDTLRWAEYIENARAAAAVFAPSTSGTLARTRPSISGSWLSLTMPRYFPQYGAQLMGAAPARWRRSPGGRG